MLDLDWNAIFGLHAPLAETLLRASLMYWALFIVFRFVIRRDVGAVGIADILLVVLVADAAQNGLAGEYRSVTEGVIVVGTLVGWNVLLDSLAFRFPAVARLSRPAPLKLVADGVMLRRNMRQEWITTEELLAKLRELDVNSLDEVEAAQMESNGTITVMRRDGQVAGKPRDPAFDPGR